MKIIAVFVLLFVLMPARAHAQCVAPGCEEATAVVAAARATARAVLTREAPTPAPTATPLPTWTPVPTSTPQPTNTATMEPTSTAQPTSTPTIEPSATATPTPVAPAGEDIAAQRWQVFGILLFCIALLVGLLWFMRDRTFYISRHDRKQ
jgi:hypothetical protein